MFEGAALGGQAVIFIRLYNVESEIYVDSSRVSSRTLPKVPGHDEGTVTRLSSVRSSSYTPLDMTSM